MMSTTYEPGAVQTVTEGMPTAAFPAPGAYGGLMDSFIQRRLRQAQSVAAPARGGGMAGASSRVGDQSRNRPDGGAGQGRGGTNTIEPTWYSQQGVARTPVTGFNMGGGYTIDPNKLPPGMRPQNAGMIPPENAVPTGSIESPDMEAAARGVQNTGGEYGGDGGPIYGEDGVVQPQQPQRPAMRQPAPTRRIDGRRPSYR